MLPHAPGVQMQAIPEDAIPEESGDEDEEDPEKRISSKTQAQGPVPSCSVGALDFSPPFPVPHSPHATHLLRNPVSSTCRKNFGSLHPLPLLVLVPLLSVSLGGHVGNTGYRLR